MYLTKQCDDNFSNDTVLVKLLHDKLVYQPGDHLAVYPTNNNKNVDTLCQRSIFPEGLDEDSALEISKSDSNFNQLSECTL